jgi:hypothetical protein
VPIHDGTFNLSQVKAWGKLALLTIRSHHESGRLLGCGAEWKIRVFVYMAQRVFALPPPH